MSDEERAHDKEFWSDDLLRPLIANVMPGEVERAPSRPTACVCVLGSRTLHAQANLLSSVTQPMSLITAAHFMSYQKSRAQGAAVFYQAANVA
jgi:hypothetical protein